MRTLREWTLAGVFLFGILSLASCKKDTVPAKNTSSSEEFEGLAETQDVVLYEVNLRAFSANGNLGGVVSRLNNIEDLGVNVIWLMPIYPVGQVNSVNSPYCVRDYQSVADEYGTLQDLKTLVARAHDKNIAVILDWVANHTAWDHPWITEHPDWYTQDGNGNIVQPPGTNWADVADLNFDSQEMRREMIRSMAFWLEEVGVDGFRCDYADGVPYDFWVEAIDSLRSVPNKNLLFFAEGNRSDHFQAGFDLAFGWDFYGAMLNVWNGQGATVLQNTNTYENNQAPAGKQWVRFTSNHDQAAWDDSPITLFNGQKGALAASVTTIFMGGVPLIFGSQEVGTPGTVPFFYNTEINWNQNVAMREAYEDILSYYSNTAAARVGTNTYYTASDAVCFTKSLNGKEVLVVVNVRNTTHSFTVPSNLQGDWTDPFSGSIETLGGQLSLNAYDYYILER